MPKVSVSRSTARRLLADIRATGSEEGDYSGDCLDPVLIQVDGRPDELGVALGLEPDRAVLVAFRVRCRKCSPCLRQRARVWAARACVELGRPARSWFGTLTVAPGHRVQIEALARRRGRYGASWEAAPQDQRFAAMARELGSEFTRYLKRVRKVSGAKFKYLAVYEMHNDGFPHIHYLLHERSLKPVTKRVQQDAWRFGYSQVKLVDLLDARPAFYVAKYLTKSACARMRASIGYGRL